MLFNSLEFLLFLPIVLILYYLLPHRKQNYMLLIASYIFYGAWNWRFLFLIFASTVVDYLCGMALQKYSTNRLGKCILIISLTFNLGALALFKYFNFFVESAVEFLNFFGIHASTYTLQVVLPVGISFYTFQTLSYTLDIYRKQLKPIENFFDFALFVSFFPQLVAGPIERAKNLLPQITHKRVLKPHYVSEGTYLILLGFFKKVVIADNLARIVEYGFDNIEQLNALSALVVIYAFAWQIYCDFSGYSDIARGCAYLMGLELMVNFNVPYFSSSPSEFWQRWHISLSSWLTDYLYIGLGGNRHGELKTHRNLYITMLLSGLWHGAGWTFVLWGGFHAFLLSCSRLLKNAKVPQLPKIIQILVFFHLVCIGWVLFRAQSVIEALQYFLAFFRYSTLSLPPKTYYLVFIVPLLFSDIFQYVNKDAFVVFKFHPIVRVLFYVGLYLIIMTIGRWDLTTFIYFQF